MVCKCGHEKAEHNWSGCLVLLGEGVDREFCYCLKYEQGQMDKPQMKLNGEIKKIVASIIKEGCNYLDDDKQPKDINDVMVILLSSSKIYMKHDANELLREYSKKEGC